MSRAPYSVPKADKPFAWGNLTAWDTTLGWRYPNPRMEKQYGIDSMGETAENIFAQRPSITREDQDAFAAESQRRAVAAIDSGRFAEEIVPVPIPQRKGDPVWVTTDERPRRDTTIESLARLKPAFRDGGSVTAGNSSGLNDGAGTGVDERPQGRRPGAHASGRIVTSAAAGVEPRLMVSARCPPRKALQRAGSSRSRSAWSN
jgi:acetyl-CoA acetyltransferase